MNKWNVCDVLVLSSSKVRRQSSVLDAYRHDLIAIANSYKCNIAIKLNLIQIIHDIAY